MTVSMTSMASPTTARRGQPALVWPAPRTRPSHSDPAGTMARSAAITRAASREEDEAVDTLTAPAILFSTMAATYAGALLAGLSLVGLVPLA